MASGNERFKCVQCCDFFRMDYKFQDWPVCLLCAEQTGFSQRAEEANLPKEQPTLQEIIPVPCQPPPLPRLIQEGDRSISPRRSTCSVDIVGSNRLANASEAAATVLQNQIRAGGRILDTASRAIFGNWFILWLAAGFIGGGIGAFCGATLAPLLSGFSGIFYSTLSNVIPAMFAFCFSGVLQGLVLLRLDASGDTTVIPWCLAHVSTAFACIVFIIALGNLSPAPGSEVFAIISTLLTNPSFGAPLAASLGSAFIGFLITQNPYHFGMGSDGKLIGIIYGTTTFFGWLLGWGLAKDIVSQTNSFEQLTSSPQLFGISMAISATIAIVFFGAIMIYFRRR